MTFGRPVYTFFGAVAMAVSIGADVHLAMEEVHLTAMEDNMAYGGGSVN